MWASSRSVWHFLRASLPPLVLGAFIVLTLREPLSWWLAGETIYDQEAIREWIREARVYNSLPELAQSYLELARKHRLAQTKNDIDDERYLASLLARKREEISEHLKALGNPLTKIYPGQLPLFPIIYRLAVTFDDADLPEITWDSELPRQISQYRPLERVPIHPGASVSVHYHLHAYTERQFKERQEAVRRLRLSGLGILFALSALVWIYLRRRGERAQEHQRLLDRERLNDAEQFRLQEELRRREAETRQQETERQNLELRSQIFANIGIMAGSYAHNIKNLLVRPNDLLRRCLDEHPPAGDQQHMLREIKQTLGTVTQRLQEILQTVRRDPGKAEKQRINPNELVRGLHETWLELAREKWKLNLETELTNEPLWIEGDLSHLQQALENLIFNARDATFEMRNHLRDKARAALGTRTETSPDDRQALISAAGWRGHVLLRTRRQGERAVLEVVDNGIGMTEEVKRRCVETHFSTKRNNALFAGLSAGMGLGLSFVTVILEQHGARLEIDSKPLEGATFRISFPLAK